MYTGEWTDGLRRTPVAVKCIRRSILLEPTIIRSLHKEAILMMKLRSRHIVTFYGICNMSCIVLEKMNLGSLYHAIHNKLDILSRRDICLQILLDAILGIEYLHEQNCIHADIKSSNVLLTEFNGSIHAKISDFGLSHIQRENMTTTTRVVGVSLRWSAPELLLEKPLLTVSCDVYSFGVVVWEVLAKSLPLADLPVGDIVRRVINGERDPIPLGYPPSMTDIINNCWDLQPNLRPAATTIRQQISSTLKEEIKLTRSASRWLQDMTSLHPGSVSNEEEESCLKLRMSNSIDV